MKKVSNKKLNKVSNKKLKKVSNKKLKKFSNTKTNQSKQNYFHKGGNIETITFIRDDNKSEINKDTFKEQNGYTNLSTLLPEKKINCMINWKNRQEMVNTYKFEININKSIPKGLIFLPPIINSSTNIYIKIQDDKHILDKTKRNDVAQPACLWLVSNTGEYLNSEDIYLGYIRADNRQCFDTEVEDKRIPQGEIMMNILIQLSKFLNFKKIKLLDQSNKYCEPLQSDRNFRNTTLLKTGDTYYGKFGFRPVLVEHKALYNFISQLLKTPVCNLFTSDSITKLISYYETPNKDKYYENKILYLKTLLDYIKTENTIQFNEINNKLITSDCMWEKIIYDLIEDSPSLFNTDYTNILQHDLLSKIYPGNKGFGLKTANFEKMELNL